MTIHTQPKKASRRPRKRRTRESQAITNLETRHIGWSGLADVIVKRAMIWEEAQSSSPERAKKIHASEEAVRLEKLERQLWDDICSAAAEEVLRDPVTKEGGNSRFAKLMPIVERRLRRMMPPRRFCQVPGWPHQNWGLKQKSDIYRKQLQGA
jgi:hypothetical protein